MINFDRFELENGLRVLVHKDDSTPMAVMNIMYNVGARDEDPNRTGFAHLFEHLMFGGSINVPEYDEPLQMAGGENNAYTTNDVTNYYLQLPVENLETAFWLESDRMLSLAFGEKSLDVQRKVVCEEFKEHYINKPYGDVWARIRDLTYKVHPYKWMTIGKELKHVEDAQLDDVKNFFFKHYTPCNAILVVAGPVQTEKIKELSEKWFGNIPSGALYNRELPVEPEQLEARTISIDAAVPLDAIYKSWHMGGRLDEGYYAADLITEIIGGGASSRLYHKLVKEKQLFSHIDCHHMGSIDPGMLVIEGKLVKGVSMQDAEAGIMEEVNLFLKEGVEEKELQKAKNKTESILAFEDMSLMNRAGNLAYYELLGDANLINTELGKFQAVAVEDISTQAHKIFKEANCSTLYYHAKKGMPAPELDEEEVEEEESV